jgi:hypothetical protein
MATGNPAFVLACHCRDCQRRTGTIFHTGAYYDQANVRVDGPAKLYVREGSSGGKVRFYFCPTCGSSVYFSPDLKPEVVGIPVGAFADPTFAPPTVSVYEESMHPWAVMPANAQRHRRSASD